ncbi:MAG: cell division protein FtsL [Erysipelotrichaceae bacterium]|nr:cell division protein FtsL [Erysipelotrichaceae bacterium]
MAKLVKRKRKIRMEGIATLFLALSICLYFIAMFGVKSYNITLAKQSQALENEQSTIKEAVSTMELEVKELQNRDRIVSIAQEDGITTNQNQVSIIPKEE